jgi:acetoin utilization protein AcuB
MPETSTFEVPRAQWAAYLARVEMLQRELPVEVEVVGPEIGDQPLVANARLRSISTADKGTAAGAIEIDLGVNGGLDHRIIEPSHLYAVQNPAGQLECLNIEDQSQTKTLIRFKQPVLLSQSEGRERGATVSVREYMTAPAEVIDSGSSLAEAYRRMTERGIRHLPVIDSRGALVGVLSDREVYLAKRERGIDPREVTVDETMARSPYSVSPDAPLEEVAAVMARRKFGSAVVVDQGRVVGLLSATDALRALVGLLAKDRS